VVSDDYNDSTTTIIVEEKKISGKAGYAGPGRQQVFVSPDLPQRSREELP
jgi:hypothetical protein